MYWQALHPKEMETKSREQGVSVSAQALERGPIEPLATSVYQMKVRERTKVTVRYYTNITQPNTHIPFTHSEEAMYKALTR